MNIILTGSSGFVGSHLARRLRDQGHHVTEVPDPFQGFTPNGPADALIHQAAITDPQDPDRGRMLRVNHEDAVELFRRTVAAGVQRIVYASSAAVYGDGPVPFTEVQTARPLTCYAQSKHQLDLSAAALSRECGVPMVGLRYSNVYGPGEAHKGKAASVVYQLCRQMKSGKDPLLFKWGEQVRDWVYVDDVVRSNLLALSEGVPGGVYNVGSGRGVTFRDVVAEINRQLGTEAVMSFISNPYRESYQSCTVHDLTKSRALLRYEPRVTLERGVGLTLASLD